MTRIWGLKPIPNFNCQYCTTLYKCSESAMECAYEGDINTARRMESICRAALLNNNAPDSELSDMSSSPLGSSNFCSLHK